MSSRHSTRLLPILLLVCAPMAFAQAPIADESAAIAESANRFMASGKPMSIGADQFKDMMASPATAPALISVCAPDDFAKAHDPGPINIPRGAFFKPPMLVKLPPKGKMIVTFDAAPYLRLLNAAELMPGNASRTYLEMERE